MSEKQLFGFTIIPTWQLKLERDQSKALVEVKDEAIHNWMKRAYDAEALQTQDQSDKGGVT